MSLGNLGSSADSQREIVQLRRTSSVSGITPINPIVNPVVSPIVPVSRTLTASSSPQTVATIATQSLSRSVSTAVASGTLENPQLPALQNINKGVEKFVETKKTISQVGGLLSRVNKDFDISGGTVDTFKDAFKGADGKSSIKNVVRGTAEYSDKAQKGIDSLVKGGIDGVQSAVDSAFRTLDETFTPKKTLSTAVGKFSEAVGWKAKVSAGFGVAWAGMKAIGGGIVKNVAKLTIGTGAFVANMGIAVTGIAAKATVGVLTPIAGAVEAVGRTVIAPVAVGVGNLVGKAVTGTAVAVGGGIAIVGKATGISSALSYVGNKIGDAAGWVADKIHTNKGKEAMKEIDSLLADPEVGITKSAVDDGAAAIKKAKGQDFETLGFKGTAMKWINIVRGRSQTTVADALAGKNLANSTGAAWAETGGTWSKRGVSAVEEIGKKGQNISGLSHTASVALPYVSAVGGVAGVVDGGISIGKNSYDIHKARKTGERLDAFKDPAKLADRLEAKANKLEKEATEAAKDGIIFGPDPKKAAALRERVATLRADVTALRTMGKPDSEMANIAQQVGSRHGMGISSANIVRGGLAVAGGTVSTVTTVSALVAGTAIAASPAGPIILGAGLAVGAGVAAYKINKELRRENVNNKLEAQSNMVDEKLKTATGPAKEKLLAVKAKIDELRARKDPQFAAQQLTDRINSEPTTESGKAKKEQAIQFARNVLKIDPDNIQPRNMPLAA